MENYIWLSWFFLFIILYLQRKKQRNYISQRILQKRKELKKERKIMLEFIKTFIGKDCIIYTLSNETGLPGTLKSISEDKTAILLEKESDHTLEIINLDYVTRIREYPLNKKGKKKSLILD